MSKSRCHRKRHVPPGPVGVWFRTQQQHLHSKKAGRDTKSNSIQRSDAEDSPCASMHSDKSDNKKKIKDNSFLPVWSKVQEDLELDTPFIRGDPKQKYDELRPHLPRHIILLREILLGDYDFAVPPGFHLLLLVNAIESHNLHSICTIELHDETGLSVRAWVEPRFVQEQMQKQQEASAIRTGAVWMLKEVGVMVQMNEDDEEVERTLLIGSKHIARVWKPENAEEMDFLQHLERKTVKTQSVSKVDRETDDFQKSTVEQPVNLMGENWELETQNDGGAVDEVTCATADNDVRYLTKKGESDISRTVSASRALHLVQTNRSTSQPRQRSLLIHDASNSSNKPIEENLTSPAQRSKKDIRQGRLTELPNGNGKHLDTSSCDLSIGARDVDPVANKRRKRTNFSPEISTQLEVGTNRSSAASLWDNVNVNFTFQLFDENDGEKSKNQKDFVGHQSIQASVPSTSSEAANHQQEECTLHHRRTKHIFHSENPVTKSGSPLCSSHQTGRELSSSLFEASNLAEMDLSAFDDEE